MKFAIHRKLILFTCSIYSHCIRRYKQQNLLSTCISSFVFKITYLVVLYVSGKELIDEVVIEVDSVPILGFLQTGSQNSSPTTNAGRIITYGDSNCLESNVDGMGTLVELNNFKQIC